MKKKNKIEKKGEKEGKKLGIEKGELDKRNEEWANKEKKVNVLERVKEKKQERVRGEPGGEEIVELNVSEKRGNGEGERGEWGERVGRR